MPTAGMVTPVESVVPSSAVRIALRTASAMPAPQRFEKSCLTRAAFTPWSMFVPRRSKPCR